MDAHNADNHLRRLIVMNNEKTNLLVMLLVASFISTTVGAIPPKGEWEDDVISLDLYLVKERADVIATARLVPVAPPYEVLGKDFFRIAPDDVVDGCLETNSMLVIITNVDSSDGKAAEVEPNLLYLLFLQRVDLSAEGLPNGVAAYTLVGNWKGIVALDKGAVERRAVRRLEIQHGINMDDISRYFVEAVKAVVAATKEGAANKSRNEQSLSEGARSVIRALKLVNRGGIDNMETNGDKSK